LYHAVDHRRGGQDERPLGVGAPQQLAAGLPERVEVPAGVTDVRIDEISARRSMAYAG
jgi:hypothetical protein